MWFVVLIPPLMFIAISWSGFYIWRKADLRNPKFFSLPDKDPDKLSIEDVRPIVDRMTSRLAWFATAIVFYLSAFISIVASIIVITQMRSDNLGRFLIIGSSLALPVIFLIFWIWQTGRPVQPAGPLFLDRLRKETSEEIVHPRLIGVFNVVAFFAIAFIVGGSCSIISSPGRSPDEVSHQVSNLWILLITGAIFLVTCVLEINQLHRWSGVAVSNDVRPEIHRAAAVMAGTIGLLFSLMLTATYLPAVTVLQYRASAVNLSVGSPLQNVFNIVAVLSPLLVGLVSSLWNSAFGQTPQ